MGGAGAMPEDPDGELSEALSEVDQQGNVDVESAPLSPKGTGEEPRGGPPARV